VIAPSFRAGVQLVELVTSSSAPWSASRGRARIEAALRAKWRLVGDKHQPHAMEIIILMHTRDVIVGASVFDAL
jgi:hypothetical protein